MRYKQFLNRRKGSRIHGNGRGTTRGKYTVKSGYNYLCSSFKAVVGPPVTNWSFVWSLKIPPKIRNFLWRALSENLPTKAALAGRHIEVDTHCSFCNSAIETSIHVLIVCPVVRKVWESAVVGLRVSEEENLVIWWNKMHRVCSQSEMEYCAAVLRCNWSNRNYLIWEGESKPVWVTLNRAAACIAEWQSAAAIHGSAPAAHAAAAAGNMEQPRTWVKPQVGSIKCNVDAAVFSNPVGMDFGRVIRDHLGQFIAAIQGTFQGHFSPLIAEAIGAARDS